MRPTNRSRQEMWGRITGGLPVLIKRSPSSHRGKNTGVPAHERRSTFQVLRKVDVREPAGRNIHGRFHDRPCVEILVKGRVTDARRQADLGTDSLSADFRKSVSRPLWKAGGHSRWRRSDCQNGTYQLQVLPGPGMIGVETPRIPTRWPESTGTDWTKLLRPNGRNSPNLWTLFASR